jgi:hypothetical protein
MTSWEVRCELIELNADFASRGYATDNLRSAIPLGLAEQGKMTNTHQKPVEM